MGIEDARKKKLVIDWENEPRPIRPNFFGRGEVLSQSISELVKYIDWKPFFDVWQLRGKYPNRGYPKIFDDETVGKEARKVFDDAQMLLQNCINDNSLRANGVFGIYKARAVGDDIEICNDEGVTTEILYGLRQQAERDSIYHCLSDFIVPKSTGIEDYIGMFAVTCIGAEELSKKFENEGDDYNSIMIKALADRIAEAFAEQLHEKVRKDHWGYCKDETLDEKALHKIQYQVI